jgi:sn-1 stearoyl-lipid 9-desaturase
MVATENRLPIFGRRNLSCVRLCYFSAIHIGAALALMPQFWSFGAISAALLMHFLTGALGISIGLHRTLAHRSVEIPKLLERLLVSLAVLDIQKPITWVAVHRLHHGHQGTTFDPHNAELGKWWAHMGWLLRSPPPGFKASTFAPDVARDPYYRFLEKYHAFLFACSFGALYLAGGWSFVLWAGCLRLVIVGHSTWAINSFCHEKSDGTNQATRDLNRVFLALFTYGEGFHRNHHEAPTNPFFGRSAWNIDVGGWIIAVLCKANLANLRGKDSIENSK